MLDERRGYSIGLFTKPRINEGINALKFVLYSYRAYGDPKLKKPKELKGIKQAFSVDYIPGKCRCPVYLEGNNIWIKHRDYFSPSMKLPTEDIGAPLNVLITKYTDKKKGKKFIYSDAWGDIVLRSEAWIKLENSHYWMRKRVFVLDILNELLRQQERLHGWEPYELCCSDMERFLERMIRILSK
jgi:hypothetical protein